MDGFRSDYLVFIVGDVVVIEDLDLGSRSVTNDMAAVVEEIVTYGVDPRTKQCVYRNSLGEWARIKWGPDAARPHFGCCAEALPQRRVIGPRNKPGTGAAP